MSSLATAKSTRDTLTLDEWQAFVDAHPLATPLHDRRWLELLREQYGFELVIPGYREGGNVSAATAFLETRGLWGGRKLLSLPFTDCFSPLSKDSEALSHLLNIIPEQVERRANRISMRIDERLSGAASSVD